jgi:hypothetical protein
MHIYVIKFMFIGKRVLIVGAGESGSDITNEISKVASKCAISIRVYTYMYMCIYIYVYVHIRTYFNITNEISKVASKCAISIRVCECMYVHMYKVCMPKFTCI